MPGPLVFARPLPDYRLFRVFLLVLVLLLGRVSAISSLARRTRSVGLTNGARINIGVQFVLPLTLTLPPVTGNGRRRLAMRSVDNEPSDAAGQQDYEDDPHRGPQLRKLDHYFEQLSLHEEACRVRLLCEMAAEPDVFHPLSDLMLAKISDVGQTDADSKGKMTPTRSRMQNYEHAVYMGISRNGTCGSLFGQTCPDGPTDLVNMPLLVVWQVISDFFDIGLYRELDT